MYKEPKNVEEIIAFSKVEPVIIYKHSATCGLSMQARKQIDNFIKEFPEVPVFLVVVQNQREISNEIEKTFEVEHQSPQVLIIKDGKSKADFSHSFIKADKIEMLVDRLNR